jgi:hypothetical protein
VPGQRGIRHAVRSAELEPNGFPDADQPEAAAHPEQRIRRLKHLHERAEVEGRGCLDEERGYRRSTAYWL